MLIELEIPLTRKTCNDIRSISFIADICIFSIIKFSERNKISSGLCYIIPENLEISGISLLPRQDSGNHGLILNCNIYASSSVEGEYVLLKKGVAFDKNKTEKEIPLAGNVSLRKIKLEITEGNLSCASLAEFSVWEKDKEKVNLTLKSYADEEKKYATYSVDTSSFIALYEGDNWAGAEPGNIFDGSSSGVWQTGALDGEPIMLTIDMIRPHTIKEMTYLPRQTPDLHGHHP
jgi:hypothetical protein